MPRPPSLLPAIVGPLHCRKPPPLHRFSPKCHRHRRLSVSHASESFSAERTCPSPSPHHRCAAGSLSHHRPPLERLAVIDPRHTNPPRALPEPHGESQLLWKCPAAEPHDAIVSPTFLSAREPLVSHMTPLFPPLSSPHGSRWSLPVGSVSPWRGDHPECTPRHVGRSGRIVSLGRALSRGLGLKMGHALFLV
jgi:hypothetical protein